MTNPDTHPMREVRSILWTLLIAATTSSVAANVAHALVTHGLTLAAIGPVLAAMLAPVALLGLFHLMSAWARAAGGRRGVFWFYLLSIVVLAGAAFRLSFAAIRDLALSYGYGYVDAALFPLILDGLIAVCTVGLVAATRLRTEIPAEQVTAPELEYPRTLTWLAPPATAEPRVTVTEHPAEQVTDPAPTTVQVDPQPAGHRPAEPAERAVTSDNTDTDPIELPAEQRPDPQRDPRPAQDAEQVAPSVTDSPEQADPPAPRFEVHRGGKASAPRPAPAAPRDSEATGAHRAIAERLVADGRTAASVEQVEQVLLLTAEGASQRVIASEVGISSTAVGRIQAAARELAEASA